MGFQDLPKRTQRDVLRLQITELTAYKIYMRIAARIKDDQNAAVVREIAGEEWLVEMTPRRRLRLEK